MEIPESNLKSNFFQISKEDGFAVLINNRQEKKIVYLSAKPNTIKWKKNIFKVEDLFGKLYNSYYQVEKGYITPIDPEKISEEDKSANSSSDEEITENDNREIYDTNKAQKLDTAEIAKIKGEGGCIDTLIEKLKENSETFNKKTVFAQEKYIKKKKRNFLRYDSLALFLHYGGIGPNTKGLIIEKCKGLVLAGVSERLSKDSDLTFAFKEESKKPLNQIACFNQSNLCLRKDGPQINLEDYETLIKKPEYQSSFTHLFIAGELNPKDIIKDTYSLLQTGAKIVVFSIFLEPLAEVFEFMKQEKKSLLIRIMDIFTRNYQVLENRTHPQVNMEGFSGYILSGYKVET